MKKLAVILVVLSLIPTALVSAQSFYVTDRNATAGMLMSASADQSVAEPANGDNAKQLLGVLASSDSVDLNAQPGQKNVKTDGVATTLVSNQHGDIKVGDRITVSSIEGVGAKASGSGWIAGIAQGSLDKSTKNAIPASVTDSKGKKHDIVIGRVPMLVKVTYYTEPTTPENQKSLLPQSIQDAADRLAGHHVKTAAIIISFVLVLMGIALAAQLVNSAIRSGFAAIARQPLTKIIILRKVLQTFAIAGVILVVVFIFAYLVLRIF